MDTKNILRIKRFKVGYEVREELISGFEFGCDDFTIKSAYTPDGHYIGDPKTAYRLVVKRGIKPEKIDDTHSICSIGFSERDGKWYGWSHRAICGFKRGSRVKKGDCAYIPSNRDEYIQSLRDWHKDCDIRIEKKHIVVTPREGELSFIEPIDIKYGRGEWIAKNLADAKKMAIDFANDVS